MKNDEVILAEIKKLSSSLERLIGANSEPNEKFSVATLDKAAKDNKQLLAKRDEWLDEEGFDKHLKAWHYSAGKVVREEFGFTGYIKRGYRYFYNKADILALAKELKKRNVDLDRYIELRQDQTNFEKCIEVMRERAKNTPRPFHLPEDLKDILTSPGKLPDLQMMKMERKKLEDEFYENKFGDYIDIYKSNYAMLKRIYHFEKFLDPQIKRRVRRWCDEFNTVNQILEEITGRKEKKFIPVPESEMIRL